VDVAHVDIGVSDRVGRLEAFELGLKGVYFVFGSVEDVSELRRRENDDGPSADAGNDERDVGLGILRVPFLDPTKLSSERAERLTFAYPSATVASDRLMDLKLARSHGNHCLLSPTHGCDFQTSE
jgi:hypothetical protein